MPSVGSRSARPTAEGFLRPEVNSPRRSSIPGHDRSDGRARPIAVSRPAKKAHRNDNHSDPRRSEPRSRGAIQQQASIRSNRSSRSIRHSRPGFPHPSSRPTQSPRAKALSLSPPRASGSVGDGIEGSSSRSRTGDVYQPYHREDYTMGPSLDNKKHRGELGRPFSFSVEMTLARSLFSIKVRATFRLDHG